MTWNLICSGALATSAFLLLVDTALIRNQSAFIEFMDKEDGKISCGSYK